MPDRRVARGVIAAGIVLLAMAALPRLPLDYAPNLALPELTVYLALPPGSGTDPMETAEQWLVPVESAIRSLGDVRGVRGEVSADGARLTVRFASGTDAELKTARLTSELGAVRARLPRDARLTVWPSAQSGTRPSVFLAVTGGSAAMNAERVAGELLAVPGVRDVEVYGGTSRQTEVRIDGIAAPSPELVRAALLPRPLGLARDGQRQLAVIAAPSAARVADVRVRAATTAAAPMIPLRSVATIRERHSVPDTVAHLDGMPAVILAVHRDADVPLFTFDRNLREAAARHPIVWSEAAELRKVLRRLAVGAFVASVLLALGGFWLARGRGLLLGLYVPLAVCAAINVLRLTSIRIDAYVLLIGAVAIAGVIPLAALRLTGRARAGVVVLFALLLPVAVALASGRLAPLLAAPARSFALTVVAAACAAYVVPYANATRATSGSRVRHLLRNSASVALAAAAVTSLLLSWFGSQLDPRRAGQSTERGRLYLTLALPAGTPMRDTLAAVERLERGVRELPELARSWSVSGRGYASLTLELAPHVETVAELDALKIRLRTIARSAPGRVTIGESYGGGGSRFSDELEDRAEADAEGHVYRVLLKGTDTEVLRRASDALAQKLVRNGMRRDAFASEWPPGTARIELVPRRGTTPEQATAVALELAAETLPPRERELPDGRVLRIIAPRVPVSPDEAPHAADVLPRRAHHFDIRHSLVLGRATRELGRWVMPVSVEVPGFVEEEKLKKRREIDRILATAPLPSGVTLERPSLSSLSFSAEKLRLFGLAAFLPVVLLAAATIVLSSFRRALLAAIPVTLGLALASLALFVTSSEVDEMTLVGIAAAACCAMPLSLPPRDALYRHARAAAAPLVLASVAIVALLAIPAAGREALQSGWRAPMIATMTVLATSVATAALLPAAFLLTAKEYRRRRHRGQHRLDPTPHTLCVRNVTKDYANGFRALRHVSFELTPGIVGLLGPNGAGKTTLLRILTGLLTPTRGQVEWNGVALGAEHLPEFRKLVGFLPQEFNAYAGLTAWQFLDYWSLERGVVDRAARAREIERLLRVVDLEKDAHRRVRDFSGGMRQRIGIARALLGDPPLLVVDEPTTGLDIEARAKFRELLQSLARDRIIILSTHIASDVAETASRILLLTKGTLRWSGTPEELVAAARGRVFEDVVSETDARALSRRCRVTTRVRVASGIRVRAVVPPGEPLPAPAVEPTLEEAYLAEAASHGDLKIGSFAFLADATR